MADNIDNRSRSKLSWLLPLSTAIIGALAGLLTATVTRINSSETLAKDYIEMALNILQISEGKSASDNDEATNMRFELRRWAVSVVNSYSRVKMSPELINYLSSTRGQKLLLQIEDDSKTDAGVLLCPSAKTNSQMLQLAIKLSSALVDSGEFGSSYISDWKDEELLTSETLKGKISIIKDNKHPEEKMVPVMDTIISTQMENLRIELPIQTVDNPSSKPSEWYLSTVICP